MSTRHAACSCGQLKLTCQGEPVRVSVCHCLECQRRTGSVFGTQARFHVKDVREEGEAKEFVRVGDEGHTIRMHFCGQCGTTVSWRIEGLEDFVMVAVGAFADPSFPAPGVSVYEERRPSWVTIPDGPDVEHWD